MNPLPLCFHIFFIFMAGTNPSEANDSTFNALFSRATQAMEIHEYKAAISSLDSCLKIKNNDPRVYNLRGCATILRGPINNTVNDRASLIFFSRAIQIDSSDHRFYANRGWAYQLLDKYPEALQDFKKALSLDTTNVKLHGNVLRTLWLQGRNKETYAYCNRLIAIFPRDGYAYHVRGQLKRDYLKKYPEGNIDIKISVRLGWEQGFQLYY